MDKKLLALLILASLSPAKATLTKIPAGFEVIAQGQQEYIEVYFSGKSPFRHKKTTGQMD